MPIPLPFRAAGTVGETPWKRSDFSLSRNNTTEWHLKFLKAAELQFVPICGLLIRSHRRLG